MSSKAVILKYNNYEIPIKISKDYNECRNEIKRKLYLQDKNLERYTLTYLDKDGYENDIDENSIEEAFNANEWVLLENEIPV